MSALITATLVVAALSAFGLMFWRALEAESMRRAAPWLGGMALLCVLALAGVIQSVNSDDSQGPCVREAQGITWNPATKTTMPYTYCAERGTWVKP